MPVQASSNDLKPQLTEKSPNALPAAGLWLQRTIIVLVNQTGKSFFSGSSPFNNVVVAGATSITLYHIVCIPHAMFKARAFRYNLTLSYKSHGCLILVTVHLLHHNSILTSWSELHVKYEETEKNLATKTEELDQVQKRLNEVSEALSNGQQTLTKATEKTEQVARSLEILEQAKIEGFSQMQREQGDNIRQQQDIINSQTTTVKLTEAQIENLQGIKQGLEEQVELLKGQVKQFKQQLEGLEAIKNGQEGVLEQLVQIVSKIEPTKGKISVNNPDGTGTSISTTGGNE